MYAGLADEKMAQVFFGMGIGGSCSQFKTDALKSSYDINIKIVMWIFKIILKDIINQVKENIGQNANNYG